MLENYLPKEKINRHFHSKTAEANVVSQTLPSQENSSRYSVSYFFGGIINEL
jgi:hypothetical protein